LQLSNMAFRILSIIACLLVGADALRVESVFNRRAVAQAIAAAPLAALAQQASAARVSNAALGGDWSVMSASNFALGAGGKAPKPTFKEFDASLEGSLGFQDGKLVDEAGSKFKSTSLTGSPQSAASLASRKGGAIPSIRLAGKWSDPAHPGCTRKVQLSGNKAFISGADEDGKPWKAVGVINGDDVTIDFSAKGGPSDVKATYVIGKGLIFPDGNVWSKA